MLSWGASAGASSYQLQERGGGGGWTMAYHGSAQWKVFYSKPDGDYEYRVRACKSGGLCSGWTAVKRVAVSRPPSAPGALRGPDSTAQDSYALSWNKPSGTVTRYELERRLGEAAWGALVVGLAEPPSYHETDRTNGAWAYRLRACNRTACSAYGAVKTVTVAIAAGVEAPPAPSSPTAASLVTRAEVDDTDKAGVIAGAFRVDEGGAATYSVPITAAAGTAGVAPEVALVYNSNAGNGIMGVGWSISGLSSISRCRPTPHQDGTAKAIQWNAEDRFCLDGQRLLKTSGVYGSPNSTYKTEVDSFVKVTAKGGKAGDPDYWEVTAKDGSKRTYGGTSDTEARGGSSTLSWALRQFEDSVGNRMLYRYHNDADGQRIKGIRYAYGSGTSDTAHQAYLRFWYEGRPDGMSSYAAGHKFAVGQRLRKVESHNKVGGVWRNLRIYHIAYKSPGTGVLDKRSKVASIQECVGDKCLPKTVFEWDGKTHGFSSQSSASLRMGSSSNQNLAAVQPADINGDGMTDLVWTTADASTSGANHRLRYALSNGAGTGFTNATFSNGGNYIEYQEARDGKMHIRVIDYNADGRSDVAVWSTRQPTWRVRLSSPMSSSGGARSDPWKLSATAIDTGIGASEAEFTDINGDGLADAVYIANGAVNARHLVRDSAQPDKSPRAYKFGEEETLYRNSSITQGDIKAGSYDFNGDGCADILVWLERRVQTQTTRLEREYHRGETFVTLVTVTTTRHETLARGPLAADADGRWRLLRHYSDSSVSSPKLEGLKAVDINGDGVTDIVRSVQSGEHKRYYADLATGTGFESTDLNLSLHPSYYEELEPADYNGDGHPDFLWRDHSSWSNRIKARLWDSDASNLESTVRTLSLQMPSWSDSQQHLFLDMDGDSNADYLRIKNGAADVYSSSDRGEFPDRIKKIANGLGAETAIRYETLSRTNHYKRVGLASATSTTTSTRPCGKGMGGCPYTTYNTTVAQTDIDKFYTRLNGDWSGAQSLGKPAPVLELNGPVPVAVRVESTAPTGDDAGSKSAVEYFYEGAKLMACGRGMLGFAKLATKDVQTGVKTTTAYRQDWPYSGRPVSTESRSSAGHLLERTETAYELRDHNLRDFAASWAATAKTAGTAALGPLQLHAGQVTIKRYALASNGAEAGDLIATTTTSTAYDKHGNATAVTVLTEGGGERFMTETANTYGPTDADRETGRLTRAVVKKHRDEDNNNSWEKTSTRRSDFNYYGQAGCPVTGAKFAGMLCQEIVEPEQSALKTVTTHSYDTWGNRIKSKSEAGSGSAKLARCDAETASYDAHGRWIETTRDCLGRKLTHVASRDGHGQPTEMRHYLNAAGTAWRTSAYGYTARGAKYFEADGAGAWKTTTAKQGAHAACPARTKLHLRERVAGGGEKITCLDALGRAARTAAKGFDGRWILQDTEYDSKGRVAKFTAPYWQGESACSAGSESSAAQTKCWTENSYDIRDRATAVRLPDGSRAATAYNGLTTIATNAFGQTHTETKNALGELTAAVDARNHRAEFEYDAQGNLAASIARKTGGGGPTAVTTTMAYDLLGRKTAMSEPHKGNWSYEYNALGELSKQTAATGDYTTMSYDGLGRMTSRKDYAGTALAGSAAWTWDTAAHGLGQLDNVQDTVSGYAKVMEYDSLGRLSETVTSLGADGALGDHYEKVTYDEFGRAFQLFDASRVTADYTDGGAQYAYNEHGYLYKVQDAVRGSDGAPRRTYRRIEAMDARGNAARERLGNGVSRKRWHDGRTGRILGIKGTKSAAGDVQDLRYEWDELGNLSKRHDRSGSKNLTETFTYDHRQNRLIKAAVAGRGAVTVRYDGFGNIRSKSDVGDYAYHADRPYAVKSVGGATYAYDANGNNTTGDGRTMTYTVFDKLKTVSKGGHVTAFEYGPDRTRYLRTDTETGQTTTTLYIGSVEKVAHPDGRREVRRYIDGLVIETKKYSAADALTDTEEQYALKDHLGSLDVITDSAGAVVEELSFDPWGKRRNPATWQALSDIDLINFAAVRTKRGFTGHEHVDAAGIIHMNGRIYDPNLARFLQADPHVQFPAIPQSHNRYSYLLNNPLNATDPTGFFLKKWGKKLKKFGNKLFGGINDLLGDFAPIVAIVVSIYLPGAAFWGNAFWGAVGSGFIAGGIATGTVDGAVAQARFSMKVFNGLGSDFPGGAWSSVSNLAGADSAPSAEGAPWYYWALRFLLNISQSGTASDDADNRANGADTPAYRDMLPEEKVLSEVYELAKQGHLGFQIPEGHEWEYRDVYGKFPGCLGGGDVIVCPPVEQGVGPDDPKRAWAGTNPKTNHTIFYRGSASAEVIEMAHVHPESEMEYREVLQLDACEKAAYVIGHEVNGHLNKGLGGSANDELQANHYGRESLMHYRAHRGDRHGC